MRLKAGVALKQLEQEGRLFTTLFTHGSLEIEIYKPAKADLQNPHSRDELYVVIDGTGRFTVGSDEYDVEPGDVVFAPAEVEHRFSHFSDDFSTWVFFYGPEGGERKAG